MSRLNSSIDNGLKSINRDSNLSWAKHGFTIIVIASLVGCETVKPKWQEHTAELDQELVREIDADLKLSTSHQHRIALAKHEQQAKIYAGQTIDSTRSRSSSMPDTPFRPKGGDIVLNFVRVFE